MSMRQNREAGQNYLVSKISNVSLEGLSWYEPDKRDVSELTVTGRDKKETYVIKNRDLENPQRRNYLDQLAEVIPVIPGTQY